MVFSAGASAFEKPWVRHPDSSRGRCLRGKAKPEIPQWVSKGIDIAGLDIIC
jgi:hypothetical protein